VHLGPQRVRAAAVGAAGLLPEREAGARLAASFAQQRLEPGSFAHVLAVQPLVALALHRSLALPVGVRSRVLVHSPRLGVERDDSRDCSVEELAVVRHRDDRAWETADEALEPFEPVEVEVVRRLVEAEHVEAREEQGGERDARRLAAGKRGQRPVERQRQPELGADLARACVEVGTAEREEALEGVVVRLGETGVG
jgi:hypothetical protein